MYQFKYIMSVTVACTLIVNRSYLITVESYLPSGNDLCKFLANVRAHYDRAKLPAISTLSSVIVEVCKIF